MNATNILKFLAELKQNNNREWFTENKVWYEQCKVEFEQICTEFIYQIGKFDEDIRNLQAKDCIYRIYRDIRFSTDKTPYKEHFGAFVARNGGRKSEHSGYYLHIEPGSCMLVPGMWSPPKNLLNAVRLSIYDNIEEFLEITQHPDFVKIYPKLWEADKMKIVPRGFPKDWEHAELLKLRHFMVEHSFSDSIAQSNDLIPYIANCAETSLPLHRFLNYTADEVL